MNNLEDNIEKITLSDQSLHNQPAHYPPSSLMSDRLCHDYATNQDDPMLDIDAQHIDDNALTTYQPPKVYENNLFAEFEKSDDEALLDVFKNSVSVIKAHQEQLIKLNSKVDKIYELVTKPQDIVITNFDQLIKPTGVFTVEDQINKLFFDAVIPVTWKSSIKCRLDPTSNKVDTVTITMINHWVKERAKDLLNKYFKNHYSNIIDI